jgi:homoserine acetyltransferase
MRFPVVTIRDMVGAQHKLVEHLGVRRIFMVAGGSIGGQQALEWAVSYPELVEQVIVVAATAALTPQAVAFSDNVPERGVDGVALWALRCPAGRYCLSWWLWRPG